MRDATLERRVRAQRVEDDRQRHDGDNRQRAGGARAESGERAATAARLAAAIGPRARRSSSAPAAAGRRERRTGSSTKRRPAARRSRPSTRFSSAAARKKAAPRRAARAIRSASVRRGRCRSTNQEARPLGFAAGDLLVERGNRVSVVAREEPDRLLPLRSTRSTTTSTLPDALAMTPIDFEVGREGIRARSRRPSLICVSRAGSTRRARRTADERAAERPFFGALEILARHLGLALAGRTEKAAHRAARRLPAERDRRAARSCRAGAARRWRRAGPALTAPHTAWHQRQDTRANDAPSTPNAWFLHHRRTADPGSAANDVPSPAWQRFRRSCPPAMPEAIRYAGLGLGGATGRQRTRDGVGRMVCLAGHAIDVEARVHLRRRRTTARGGAAGSPMVVHAL